MKIIEMPTTISAPKCLRPLLLEEEAGTFEKVLAVGKELLDSVVVRLASEGCDGSDRLHDVGIRSLLLDRHISRLLLENVWIHRASALF